MSPGHVHSLPRSISANYPYLSAKPFERLFGSESMWYSVRVRTSSGPGSPRRPHPLPSPSTKAMKACAPLPPKGGREPANYRSFTPLGLQIIPGIVDGRL